MYRRKNDRRGASLNNQPLGSHGVRLKLAYALGGIGPKTYRDSKNIHSVRNKMAHNLDVDSFDHAKVKQVVDAFECLSELSELQQVRLAFRRDKFLCACSFIMMQIWSLLDESTHSSIGIDRPAERLDPKDFAT